MIKRTGKLGTSVKWGLTDYARFLIALSKPALLPSEALVLIKNFVIDLALRYHQGDVDRESLFTRLRSILLFALPRIIVLAAVSQDEGFLPAFRSFLTDLGEILSSTKMPEFAPLLESLKEDLKTEGLVIAAKPKSSLWPSEALEQRKAHSPPDEEFKEFFQRPSRGSHRG